MDIYFDTEFTDFVVDPALISIGFVSVDGKEFYAAYSAPNWTRIPRQSGH